MSAKVTAFAAAGALDGTEIAPVIKGGVQKRTTTGEIAALAAASAVQDERIRDVIGACLAAGAAVTLTVNDAGDAITIAVDTAAIDERARDALGAALVAGAGISITPNDGADTITIASTSNLNLGLMQLVSAGQLSL
jgi:hypothetical protein